MNEHPLIQLPYGSRSLPSNWDLERIELWRDVFDKVFKPNDKSLFRHMTLFQRGGHAIDISNSIIVHGSLRDILNPSDWCASVYNLGKRLLTEKRHWGIYFLRYMQGMSRSNTAATLGISRSTYIDDNNYVKTIIGRGLIESRLYPLHDPASCQGFFD